MRFTKMMANVIAAAGVIAVMIPGDALGQPSDKSKVDSTKAIMHSKHLKPQTTCPVTGDAIDKKLFVDYQGKRIYVCCADCLAKVKKDPEAAIKKLESIGQSVEIIGNKAKKESKDVKADTSMKSMKMSGETAAKAAESGYWTCPMHPEVHQSAAGQCPICGMNLIVKKSDVDTTKIKGMDHSKMKM